MTPKEKAEEIFYKMSYNSSDEDHHCSHYVAKNCALIAVDEIIQTIPKNNGNQTNLDYWKEVKKEIDEL